jgi:hypothetical protein
MAETPEESLEAATVAPEVSTGVDNTRLESRLEKVLGLSPKGYVAAILLGLVVTFSFCGDQLFTISEYAVLYAGGRLAGTPDLYDKAANRREQIKANGTYGGDELIYSRPPFVAAILAPLAKLPYRTSLVLFEAISFAALVGFIALWPRGSIALKTLLCAWSVPVALSFGFVREGPILLLILALALRTYKRRPFAAGLLLSMLAIKFHLFLLLPILFIGQRRCRMAFGFMAGAAALLIISFYSAGLSWPWQMAEIIKTSAIDKQYLLPNLRGIVQPFTNSFWPEAVLGLVVAGIVYRVVSTRGFECGLCAVIVGSLLVGHHAGFYDCVVLIPVVLFLAEIDSPAILALCVVILSPGFYALLSFAGIASFVAKLFIPSLLVMMWMQAPRPAGRRIELDS